MSADATQEERQEEAPLIVHDDIVQRLLEYQAQLREGIAAEEAPEEPSRAVGPAPGLIDYSALEAVDTGASEVVQIPESETTDVVAATATITSAAEGDLPARVSMLEGSIAQIASSLAELRTQAQDSALAIDDRLAEVIEKLDAIVPPSTGEGTS